MSERARTLRREMTEAEWCLWYQLRAHRFMGLKFKRQKPFGCYIVDFVCQERRLIIELDGGQHVQQAAYDEQRDDWLRAQGFDVLRFWNHEVLLQTDAVLEQLRLWVEQQRPSPPAPLPQAGEGS
ncbi:endonuclease domain-containing protein [Pseudomonas sp. EA_35y_Pfl2_R111]|uniref:endonuclease domain-containing protein n=1 Tax=Pseudomonas sp. EA_35y_Pfl2_R111 TaxID=3088689 RepID=UPI0030DD11A9